MKNKFCKIILLFLRCENKMKILMKVYSAATWYLKQARTPSNNSDTRRRKKSKDGNGYANAR